MARKKSLLVLKLEKFERRIFLCALVKHDYNVTKAARFLGINRGSMYRRLDDLGIHMEDTRIVRDPRSHRGNSLWQELSRLDRLAA